MHGPSFHFHVHLSVSVQKEEEDHAKNGEGFFFQKTSSLSDWPPSPDVFRALKVLTHSP